MEQVHIHYCSGPRVSEPQVNVFTAELKQIVFCECEQVLIL